MCNNVLGSLQLLNKAIRCSLQQWIAAVLTASNETTVKITQGRQQQCCVTDHIRLPISLPFQNLRPFTDTDSGQVLTVIGFFYQRFGFERSKICSNFEICNLLTNINLWRKVWRFECNIWFAHHCLSSCPQTSTKRIKATTSTGWMHKPNLRLVIRSSSWAENTPVAMMLSFPETPAWIFCGTVIHHQHHT